MVMVSGVGGDGGGYKGVIFDKRDETSSLPYTQIRTQIHTQIHKQIHKQRPNNTLIYKDTCRLLQTNVFLKDLYTCMSSSSVSVHASHTFDVGVESFLSP